MGCIVVLIGLAAPRFALFLTWLFTDRMSIAFDSFIQGFLGFLLLPFATLFYVVCYSPVTGVRGFGWVLVLFGLALDLSSWFGGGREGRRRAASA